MWMDLIQWDESFKEQTLRLPGKKGILPQDHNLGILLAFPACWPVPRNSNSRRQLQFIPELPACFMDSALWIPSTCFMHSNLPAPIVMGYNSLQNVSLSSYLFPNINSSSSLGTSDWYRPHIKEAFPNLEKGASLYLFSVTLVSRAFCPSGLGDSYQISCIWIWLTPSLHQLKKYHSSFQQSDLRLPVNSDAL